MDVSKFEMYETSKNKQKSELGVIGHTVARLCADIGGQNHKIFLDNS
jgi:DNA-binding ferritin-like protein (Dps family)